LHFDFDFAFFRQDRRRFSQRGGETLVWRHSPHHRHRIRNYWLCTGQQDPRRRCWHGVRGHDQRREALV